jgi:hypothetical protein
VRSRLGLVALWAVFAAASVGVGFAAAGLVGDPFTDPGGAQVSLAGTSGSGSTGDTSSGSPTPSGTSSTPSGSRTTPTPSRAGSSTPAVTGAGGTHPAPAPVVRSLTTRGGLVSGSCTRGLVTISAAPTVGWAIKDIEGGPTQEARVRFEPTGDRDGRVEVRAHCVGGVPRFSVEDRTDNSGPGGGGESGSGSDDGGGGGGSGPG